MARTKEENDQTQDLDLGGFTQRREASPAPSKPKATATGKIEVCPFTVVIDSREQLPYTFDGLGVVVPTVVAGLRQGDYSIQGFENDVTIERKSLDDLYGSCTHGRKRFEAEIMRMEAMTLFEITRRQISYCPFAAVVIEATWPEIADPATTDPTWSNLTNPESILGTITAWSIRYPRVHWWAAGNRREAEKQVFRALRAFWKEVQDGGQKSS